MRKQIHFIVDALDGQLRTPNITRSVYAAAERVLHRCRKGLVKQVVVSDRVESEKRELANTGRVW
jgi:hypothetical protein